MGKIAFVFPGQGAQFSGMGKDLYLSQKCAHALYEMAEAKRPGTMAQSFEGSDEELKQTVNAQPCLYLIDLAAALSLQESGIVAEGVAGFSLGELAALAFAGAYSYEDGFSLVTKRGLLMDEATKGVQTAMCAVLKLDKETVIAAAKECQRLYAVNFNSPGQTVVSGLKESMPEFEEKIKALGGRCVPLAVSGAFHSPFMQSAAQKFEDELKSVSLEAPKIPVYANLTAKPYTQDIKATLSGQITGAVRWQETIERMIEDGFTDFIEVGAGKTLCGLIKKINKEVRTYAVQDSETLANTIEAVKQNA